jgi:hypothetical protein
MSQFSNALPMSAFYRVRSGSGRAWTEGPCRFRQRPLSVHRAVAYHVEERETFAASGGIKMSHGSLEQRVAALEEQMANLRATQANGLRTKDWRRTVGMFTDSPQMQELFAEAQKLREADRKKTRVRRTRSRRVKS